MESQKRNRPAAETAVAFIRYAEVGYRNSSPLLYQRLARAIAQDAGLLEIAKEGDETVPNVFLGAPSSTSYPSIQMSRCANITRA